MLIFIGPSSADSQAGDVGAALSRNRHAMDSLHTTIAVPTKKPSTQLPVVPVSPRATDLVDPSHWPPGEPFLLRLRLSLLAFPGGPAALPVLFFKAPGGAFGKVIVCAIARSGTPVAVKVLLAGPDSGTDRDGFLRESENLLLLRNQSDIVRTKNECGNTITLEETGALHVAYAYGTGEEEDLSAVDAALPRGPAFLIAVEPLAETLTQRMRRAPGGLLPIVEVLRAAHEIALGLAFIGKHNVVVRRVVRLSCIL